MKIIITIRGVTQVRVPSSARSDPPAGGERGHRMGYTRGRTPKHLGLLFLFIFFLTFFLFFPKPAHAALTLGVYPPILQIQAIPPTSIKQNISIQNLGDSPLTLDIVLKPFTASNKDNGEVKFLEQKDVFGADPNIFQRIQILDGSSPVEQVTLAPTQQKTLTIHIGLPKDEPPSDYYFSVLFISSQGQVVRSTASTVAGGIGTNVLLSIGPKSATNGFLEEFSTPFFLTHGPVPFTVSLHNLSKHFIVPNGEILIKDMFGKVVGKVDLLPVNVLSQTSRLIPDNGSSDSPTQAIWDGGFLLGPYKASLILSLAPEGPVFTRAIYFFALPIPIFIGGLIVILLTITIILRVRKRIKKGQM